MVEAEAKTKWCPFARVGSGVNGLGAMNRDALPPEHDAELVIRHSLCIGSACMAWRWVPEYPDKGPPRKVMSAVDGYCGLAGAPQ